MATWYSAKLLFEATVDGVREPNAVCEESIRVLLSETEGSARAKAEGLGKAGEHEYLNESGQTVRWVFISVLEVQELDETELTDGTEVFSTLSRSAEKGQ